MLVGKQEIKNCLMQLQVTSNKLQAARKEDLIVLLFCERKYIMEYITKFLVGALVALFVCYLLFIMCLFGALILSVIKDFSSYSIFIQISIIVVLIILTLGGIGNAIFNKKTGYYD